MGVPSASYPTWFYVEGESEVWDWPETLPLVKGDGVVTRDGRFRVVDVWFSFDQHGHFDVGLHVFLERSEGDDTLTRIAPGYFTS